MMSLDTEDGGIIKQPKKKFCGGGRRWIGKYGSHRKSGSIAMCPFLANLVFFSSTSATTVVCKSEIGVP